jgi:hypothetical protein
MDNIKELYVTNGTIMASKYVLTVMNGGTLSLVWYIGASRIPQGDPIMVKSHDKSMMVEYGAKNLFGTRASLPFLNSEGKLEPRWEKIK